MRFGRIWPTLASQGPVIKLSKSSTRTQNDDPLGWPQKIQPFFFSMQRQALRPVMAVSVNFMFE